MKRSESPFDDAKVLCRLLIPRDDLGRPLALQPAEGVRALHLAAFLDLFRCHGGEFVRRPDK
jgi:hypothetical protein